MMGNIKFENDRLNLIELKSTMYSLLYFLTCTIIMVFIQILAEFDSQSNKDIILDDIFFQFFSNGIYNSEELIECMVNISVIYAIIRVFFNKNNRNRFFQHAFITIGTTYILRGIILSVTRLPNPYKSCEFQLDVKQNIIINILSVMFKIKKTCSDVLFSGYGSTLTLLTLLSNSYFHNIETYIIMIYSLITSFLIIISRFHYSVDVIVGIIITYLLYTSIDLVSNSNYNDIEYIWFPLKPLIKNLIPSSNYSKTSKKLRNPIFYFH